MSDIQSHAYYDLSVYPSRISSTLETELTTDNWHIFLILYGSYVNTCCCVELWGRLVVSWAIRHERRHKRYRTWRHISFDVVIRSRMLPWPLKLWRNYARFSCHHTGYIKVQNCPNLSASFTKSRCLLPHFIDLGWETFSAIKRQERKQAQVSSPQVLGWFQIYWQEISRSDIQ